MATRKLICISYCAFAFLLVRAGNLPAELLFNGNARSLFYSHQSYPGAYEGDAVDNFRYFQAFSLNMVNRGEKNSIGFHTFFRVTDDFSQSYPDDPNSRLYNGYLEWKNKATGLALGRQWIHLGPSSLTLDGLKFSQSCSAGFDFTGFLGSQTPFSRKFETQGWDRAKSGGVYLRNKSIKHVSLGAGFQQKDYMGATSFREVGLDGTLDLPHNTNILGRVDMNLLDHSVQRAVLRSRFRAGSNWGFTGEYRHYEPNLIDKSYFKRFDLEGNDQFRGGATYYFLPEVTLSATYTGIVFEDNTDSYTTVSAGCPYGSVSWFHGSGKSGDQDGFAVSGSYSFARAWELFADVDYSLYRFYEEVDRNYDFASVAGLNWRPCSAMLAGVELQNLNNDVLSKDFRVLIKFSLNYSQMF